jgi:hypothetical protein
VQDEDPREVRLRTWLDSRLQNALHDALDEIREDAEITKRALFGDPRGKDDDGIVSDVKTLKAWITGGMTKEGEPVIGISQKVQQIWKMRTVVVGLLATIATAIILNLVVNALALAIGVKH